MYLTLSLLHLNSQSYDAVQKTMKTMLKLAALSVTRHLALPALRTASTAETNRITITGPEVLLVM
jgi:hypothetical protein